MREKPIINARYQQAPCCLHNQLSSIAAAKAVGEDAEGVWVTLYGVAFDFDGRVGGTLGFLGLAASRFLRPEGTLFGGGSGPQGADLRPYEAALPAGWAARSARLREALADGRGGAVVVTGHVSRVNGLEARSGRRGVGGG